MGENKFTFPLVTSKQKEAISAGLFNVCRGVQTSGLQMVIFPFLEMCSGPPGRISNRLDSGVRVNIFAKSCPTGVLHIGFFLCVQLGRKQLFHSPYYLSRPLLSRNNENILLPAHSQFLLSQRLYPGGMQFQKIHLMMGEYYELISPNFWKLHPTILSPLKYCSGWQFAAGLL